MLSGSEALSYLMDKELIRTRDIVEHGVEIVNVSRRNLNYQVRVPERTGVFLKHGQDSHKTRTLRHEAEIYRLLESLDCDAIRAIVPKCYGFDDRVAVLTLELINGATSLFDTHHRTRKISSDIARRLGTALADFHMATAAPAVRQRFEQQLESRVPDALVLHAPSLTFYGAYASYGNLKVLRAVRRCAALFRGLDQLCAQWPRACIVHGDLRWDNILLAARTEGRRFKIVDWELATLGDPAWDVGCLFAEHLTFWLGSAPLTPRSAPEDVFAYAQVSLSRLQPAVGAFWRAYRQRRGWTDAIAQSSLQIAVRYAAARLFQAAIEQTQNSTSLSALAVFQLQLAANLFESPSAAALALLGLSEPSIAPVPVDSYAEEAWA